MFTVRNFTPGNPSDTFEANTYETESEAHHEYAERCETINEVGGGVELLAPDGVRIAWTSRRLGKARGL